MVRVKIEIGLHGSAEKKIQAVQPVKKPAILVLGILETGSHLDLRPPPLVADPVVGNAALQFPVVNLGHESQVGAEKAADIVVFDVEIEIARLVLIFQPKALSFSVPSG